MPAKRREATARVAVLSNCRHYWIIDCSQQVESKGRCRLCGEERVFQNKLSSANKKPEVVIEAVPLEAAPFGAAPFEDQAVPQPPDDPLP